MVLPATAAPARLACHAPFTSVYLDPRGWVRACAVTHPHVLGNVADAPLTELWRSAASGRLRRAILDEDLDYACSRCAWQIRESGSETAFARLFDELPVASVDPPWPVQAELALSNTCNLRCVMCNGGLSSAIRRQREGLARVVSPYDDRFFDDLATILPHLERVKFLGGEPFLSSEAHRVWTLLEELGLPTPCHVTTNGSVWNEKVEGVLDGREVAVSVSIDGFEKETVEAIRVGVDHGVLMANLDRFAAYAGDRGTFLGVTYCLMTSNWQELRSLCSYADDLGITVFVNTVMHPSRMSLYELEPNSLDAVVDAMEAQDRGREPLGASAEVWADQQARLRQRVAELRRPADRPASGTFVPLPSGGGHGREPTRVRTELRRWAGCEPTVLRIESGGQLRFHTGSPRLVDLRLDSMGDLGGDELVILLGSAFGSVLETQIDGPHSRRVFGTDTHLTTVRAWRTVGGQEPGNDLLVLAARSESRATAGPGCDPRL